MVTRAVLPLLGLAIAVAVAHENEEEGEGSLRPGRSISYDDESNDGGDDAVPGDAADVPPPDASQLAPYFSQNITFLEAENMTEDGGWEARQWGHGGNYFSSTVNNVFMSRRMYLHAPANASTSTVARATITVTEDGEYMVMARYEALYRYETGFKVTVEQDSKTLLSAVYGRRSNPKVWGQKGQGTATFNESGANCADLLNPECVWQWGSVENMVWEGVNNTVQLKPGSAVVTLTVHRDSESDCAKTMLGQCQYADRNIDALMFMPNRTDIDHRWNGPGNDPSVLAFDGLFSQAGEVFFKVINHDHENNMTLSVPVGYFHNPYFFEHVRLDVNIGPLKIFVPPGCTTDWVDTGALLDTQNHGTWNLPCGNYSVVFGIKDKPFDRTDKKIVALDSFNASNWDSQIVWDASVRMSRRVRHSGDDFYDIMDSLRQQGPVHGQPLSQIPVFAGSFTPDPITGGPTGGGCGGVCTAGPAPKCASRPDPDFSPAVKDFKEMYCTTPNCLTYSAPYANFGVPWGNMDGKSFDTLNASVQKAINASKYQCGEMCPIKVVNLGDEIGVAAPASYANDTAFELYCKQHSISLDMLGCDDTNWTVCTQINTNASLAAEFPGLFYHSSKFMNSAAIRYFKNVTDFLRLVGLDGADTKFGANFSPGNYVGLTFMYIRLFRERAFTLPWSEDWIWQIPVASQQIMTVVLDAFRSGVSWQDPSHFDPGTTFAPELADYSSVYPENGTYAREPWNQTHVDMLMYIMHHFPGNTVKSWKRQLFGDVSHGVTNIDLFLFDTSLLGYTCDYVDADGGAYPGTRAALNQLGMFEDIIVEGVIQPRGAPVALLYSETTDIWREAEGPIDKKTGKTELGPLRGDQNSAMADFRTSYLALKHANLEVDVLIEGDTLVGRLKHYSVLYVLSTPQITGACARAIAAWVASGGVVVSTGGGGLLDEYNRTNDAMEELLGVTQTSMYQGEGTYFNTTVFWTRQDLPYVQMLDTVKLSSDMLGSSSKREPLSVKGRKSIFTVNESVASRTGNTDSVEILATFDSNGGPAVTRRRVGRGFALYLGFFPGLSYFDSAIPRRPISRGTLDTSFNHWVPTDFNVAAKALLSSPIDDPLYNVEAPRAVTGSNQLVEIGMVTAPGGTAFPCVNWAGAAIEGFVLTIHHELEYKQASLASGGGVTASAGGWPKTFSFNLADDADALILR